MDSKIQEVQQKGMQNGFSKEIHVQENLLIQEFSLREQQEEVFWNQKSKVKWLQEGEQNTGFFHKYALQHHQGNCMERMKTKEGNIIMTWEDLELTLNSFFSKILDEPDWDRESD